MSTAAPCAPPAVAGDVERSRIAGTVVLRYVLSAAGPVCISAAHFIAALVFLHTFTRAEFGQFSFLLVIVPFCLSLAGAMIGAPAAVAVRHGSMIASELVTYLKTNLALGSVAGVSVCTLMWSSGGGWHFALISGAYGAVMTLRWFARTLTYARGPAYRVLVSDVLYSAFLVAALLLPSHLHRLTPLSAVQILCCSCFLAWLSFGPTYLREQFAAALTGSLGGYVRIWNQLARWSAFGVVLTEFTANAHAYLVTFIAGPAAFAPLAVGALLMRPVQLVLAAIPDRERPTMAILLGSGNYPAAQRSVNHFRMAAGAVWLLTATTAAGLLLWYPQLILRKGYEPSQALTVLGFFAVITAVRSFRTPESVLLQAAGEFRALAFASLFSSMVSLAATLALLIFVGPVFSLAGILAGEIVVTMRVRATADAWMRCRA
ncbi:MAG TPA: hypothetical protein VHT03_02265 [Rhizomicrobium sp.]|jgi:hypothetical protein|nr:hypothetical protein [Rhizomicrobium sp.]